MTVLHGLPPQCWSSSSPSSQGCSASWTTSTSATPLWRRRWPWPPSCRACSPSQVAVSMLPRASQEPSVTPQGLLAGGRKPHSMAIQLSSWSNQVSPCTPSFVHHSPGCAPGPPPPLALYKLTQHTCHTHSCTHHYHTLTHTQHALT